MILQKEREKRLDGPIKGREFGRCLRTLLASLTSTGRAQDGLLQGQLGGLAVVEVLQRHL